MAATSVRVGLLVGFLLVTRGGGTEEGSGTGAGPVVPVIPLFGEPSIAMAVLSSDARIAQLAPTILRTWARDASQVVLFVDSPDAARKWDRLSKVASHGTVAVAQCCPNNSTLGDKISTAQYKLEHTFFQMLRLAPNASFYVFTDDDTYWNMPLLHRTIGAASAWVDAATPTALYPGRRAGAMPGYAFCQTSGPFMIMNHALVAMLADEDVLGACRDLVIRCYNVYRSRFEPREGIPALPFGDCPARRAWVHPYKGALYNNDHLINLCTASHHDRGRVNSLCLPGFEFDVAWAICADNSPYWHHRDWSRRYYWCRSVCNITIGCPLDKLFEQNLERLASAQVPLFVHNQVGISLDRLAAAMAHGESLVFAHAPQEPTRAQRVIDSIVAYHHATASDMNWLHTRRTDPNNPRVRAVSSWPRSWGAKISVEYWLRRVTGLSFSV